MMLSLKDLKPENIYKDHEYNWVFYLISIEKENFKLTYLSKNAIDTDFWFLETKNQNVFELLT